MATIITHALVAVAVVGALGPRRPRTGLFVAGMALAMAPDLDVLGFPLGIEYSAPWGHRGLTHSLLFALLIGSLSALVLCRSPTGAGPPANPRGQCAHLALILSVCMASHGLLDMLTNGGLGVALFAPFDPGRMFFAVNPLQVSPIGFHGWSLERTWAIARSELLWVGLPALAVAVTIRLMRRRVFGR
ncbi:MAG: metal-dependent hydrolase [Gammaproteobacteria bacterium]